MFVIYLALYFFWWCPDIIVQCRIDVSNESSLSKPRIPVKLTGKQGFVMNQLLATYALENPTSILCKNHTKDLKIGARAFESWALKMLDASSKLQSGLLLGNLVEYGSYRQCLNVFWDGEWGPIWGKHCMIRISPSKKLLLQILKINNIEEKRDAIDRQSFTGGWSVCVPHSCPTNDILYHFEKIIRELTTGVDLEIILNDNLCNSVLDNPTLDRRQTILLLTYICFILMSVIASLVDINLKSDDQGLWLKIFSAYRNTRKICAVAKQGSYDFLFGLRFISCTFVIMGHRFVMLMIYPMINGLEELEWPNNYSSLLILGCSVCVDTFFLVSAMLVSIGFFQHVTETGCFNIVAFYLYRYLRISVPLAVIVLFYNYLVHFIVDGPYKYDTYIYHQKPCQDYWWSTLLHIQNFVNPESLCLFPIWYLSCEMPFYYFAPAILYPLWKWPKIGYAAIITTYSVSMSLAFYMAWTHEYSGMPVEVSNELFLHNYFQRFYVAPHIRIPPYILGLTLGYFLHIMGQKKIILEKRSKCLGWILSSSVMFISAAGCRNFYLDDHKYNRLEATAYLTFARSSWSVGLMWMIWCCMNGYGGVINEFLSANIFKIFGRLTYGMFLLHSTLQVYKGGSSKVASTFSNFNTFYDGVADIGVCIILSYFFTIFFEMPLATIQNILISKESVFSR